MSRELTAGGGDGMGSRSTLHCAVLGGSPAIVEWVLSLAGELVSHVDGAGITPFGGARVGCLRPLLLLLPCVEAACWLSEGCCVLGVARECCRGCDRMCACDLLRKSGF